MSKPNPTPATPAAIFATIKIKLLRRPLLLPETCQDCLDITRRELMMMIETGELPWAWNIGLGGYRKEIRVLAHCVCEKQLGPLANVGATKNLELPAVLNLFMPPTVTRLRSTQLQRLFGCRHDEIRRLNKAGFLTRVPEKLPTDGPHCSPSYTRESVLNFFEKRRML